MIRAIVKPGIIVILAGIVLISSLITPYDVPRQYYRDHKDTKCRK